MPVETMLLLSSSSPPSYTCSSFYTSCYMNLASRHAKPQCNIIMAPQHETLQSIDNIANSSGPLRSCLRIQDGTSDASAVSSSQAFVAKDRSNNGVNVSLRTKKSVCFADSKGLSLAMVKIMEESSDTPPKLSPAILSMITQDAKPQPSLSYKYVPSFEQPASNYLKFRECLESQNVCLENIVVKDDFTVMGTLKVKNIFYQKLVFLRTTFDQWKSFTDFEAKYVQSAQSVSLISCKYDTFSFEFQIPTNCRVDYLEFCICFRSNAVEFWDNNSNANYRLQAEELETNDCRPRTKSNLSDSYKSLDGNYIWSSFSYWKVGDDERPYW